MFDQKMCSANKLPLGLMDFSNIIEKNKIYVDKTSLIYKIACQDSPIFISRPRRFGKSLLINTLKSLFSKGLVYFNGLDIEKMWNDKTYHVVHLDFSEIANSNIKKFQFSLSRMLINEFGVNYNISDDSPRIQYPNLIFSEIIKNFNNNTIVLLIDEYDAPLVHHINQSDELKEIIDTLSDFYATVKRYTDKFRFIFITGVTRVSHVSIFSAFNNIVDLSLKKEFNSILGFTKDDLRLYFDPYIENASQVLEMSKNDVYGRLEQYYDGYQFSIDIKETVYNPWSILSFLHNPGEGFQNYWFESGGASSIIMQYLKISDSSDIINYKR